MDDIELSDQDKVKILLAHRALLLRQNESLSAYQRTVEAQAEFTRVVNETASSLKVDSEKYAFDSDAMKFISK